MAGGRPTEYKPEYCEQVIEMGKKGYSRVQIAAQFEVAKSTLQSWESLFPEFSVAIQKAMTLSQSWWEEQGMNGVWEIQGGPKINAGLYAKSMAARFPDDWRDSNKVELTGKDGGPMQNEITVKFVE